MDVWWANNKMVDDSVRYLTSAPHVRRRATIADRDAAEMRAIAMNQQIGSRNKKDGDNH
jgi:hypothetical protein